MEVRSRVVVVMKSLARLLALVVAGSVASACGYDGPSLDVAVLKAKLDADPGSLLVVDVRPNALFGKGHIQGATNIPLEKIDSAASDLAALHRPIAVICTCGKRSLEAIGKLRARGLEPCLVVGGMLEWEKAGYPVVR
jgi:rhodanese-related sulfurtransferase